MKIDEMCTNSSRPRRGRPSQPNVKRWVWSLYTSLELVHMWGRAGGRRSPKVTPWAGECSAPKGPMPRAMPSAASTSLGMRPFWAVVLCFNVRFRLAQGCRGQLDRSPSPWASALKGPPRTAQRETLGESRATARTDVMLASWRRRSTRCVQTPERGKAARLGAYRTAR